MFYKLRGGSVMVVIPIYSFAFCYDRLPTPLVDMEPLNCQLYLQKSTLIIIHPRVAPQIAFLITAQPGKSTEMYVISIYGKTRYIRYIIHLSKKHTVPDITNYNNRYNTCFTN
jgi:hypothetical protein